MFENVHRPYCFTCFKAKATCVCDLIEQVNNRTAITVIQHPRERGHPIGTARFVDLGLARSTVVVGYENLKELALPPGAGLLYPHDDAEDLESLSPGQGPSHLVVIDGTWAHAKAIYKKNPWLHSLKHYRLSPSAPSRYRIRREPQLDYVSTLESVVLALQILEPELPGLQTLLAAFDSMVDTQIEYQEDPTLGRPRVRKRPPRDFRGVPHWFAEDFDDVVAVHAGVVECSESSAPLVVQVAAQRLGGGEQKQWMLSLSDAATEAALSAIGLCFSDFADAVHAKSFESSFQDFVKDSLLLAWNQTTKNALLSLLTHVPHIEEMRVVIRSFKSQCPGSETYKHGDFDEPTLRGRADLRMQYLVGIARHTLEQAKEEQRKYRQ